MAAGLRRTEAQRRFLLARRDEVTTGRIKTGRIKTDRIKTDY